ncbi:ATP-binding protein [Clostridium hydrogenum]|uniref:ATP-binding protein n=1 Tax=Clostridium hydrogenum TaxID=2855764 RepID=UPI001F1D659F|nr:ATP-binding protein [Clostridium hydrogenum]
MFKKNITFKLTAGFITIVIISTLVIGIISLNIFKNNIYSIKRNNMKNHALEISKTLSPYMSKNANKKEFIDIINLIDSIDNAKLWILDSNKNIVTASDRKSSVLTYINDIEVKNAYTAIISKALRSKEAYDEIYNPYYKQYMMAITVPIKNSSGSVIGAVILNSSLYDLSNSMDKFFIYIILALLVEMLLAGLMSYYFSKNISKPIRKINSSALELARGNYGIKTNIYKKDEIGELSSSFDLLSLKLKYTIGKLFEEKTKLNNILISMSEGILAIDGDFNIININASAKKMLCISNEAIIKQKLIKLNMLEEFKLAITTDAKASVIREYQSKVLNLSISPIKSNLKEVIGGVILIQDISEKEKLEQLRKDFISNVSHEFRTPLTVIKGNLESIIDGITEPTQIIDNCSILLKEANRLERMVKDLLNLSRLKAGKLEVQFSKLDVNMLINDTLRSLRTLLNKKNINLELSLQPDLPPLFNDYDKLKQLLIIFLDNGIKFSPNNGILKVSTYSDIKGLYITIWDNGVGIPQNEIEYLGEKFFKADKSRASNIEGTGLGLSIAKRLVKVLNGQFTIESKLKKGTKITISFYTLQKDEVRL